MTAARRPASVPPSDDPLADGDSGVDSPLPDAPRDPVRILYVSGIGRSGSTILGGALGQMLGHAGVGEVMRFLERGLLRNEPCSCGSPTHDCEFWGPVVPEMRRICGEVGWDPPQAVREIRRVTEGRRAPGVLLRGTARSRKIQRVMERLYRLARERAGRQTLVDTSKNPVWLDLLLGLPGVDVRVLHLVRDSRSVANSFRKHRSRNGRQEEEVYMYRHPAVVTAVGWTVVNLLVRRIGRRARSYGTVRHEDFVREPREVVARHADGKPTAAAEATTTEVAATSSGAREPHADRAARDGLRIDFARQHLVAGNPVRMERSPVRVVSNGIGEDGLSTLSRAVVTVATAAGLIRHGYLGRPDRE